jgi:hypothetical protein
MAVLLAKVSDIRAGGFKDPQAQQAGHGHQREVARAGGLPGCGEQGLELLVREPRGAIHLC